MDIDWASIHPLNGSKQDAFEELCTQLARVSCPTGSKFIRKGRPDAGVEAHVIHPDRTEWAWQSKYFDAMRSSQWTQLDESVKTALVGHPNLTRFIVCVPVDLPDGRTSSARTARQQWNERVEKWSGWATRSGMSVEFVWQGSHEMLTELAKPLHDGLVHFFFGMRHLDDSWFAARLSEALLAAGPRYTPELNIELPLSHDFDAFGRTQKFFDGVRARARRITDRMRNHAFSLVKEPNAQLQKKMEAAQLACDHTIEEFKALSNDPVQQDPLGTLKCSLREAVRKTGDLFSEYQQQREEAKVKRENSSSDATVPQEESDHSYTLRELNADLRDALSHIDKLHAIASGNLAIIAGDAGSGKTHLLCDLAKQRSSKGLPSIVLMGQRFLDSGDPWTQALQQLDVGSWNAGDLVKVLEVVAQRANSRVLFIIDAINEGAGRQLWPAHLSAFLHRLKASPWIGIIISVRSSYAADLLPEDATQGAVWLEHRGFEDVEFDATRAFFEYFGIDLPSTPLLAPEFSNPLYLKTLCLGLQASGQKRLPRGFHGVVNAFIQYVAAINRKAALDLDYDKKINLVADALKALARHMVDSRSPWLSYSEARKIVDTHLPGRDYSRSLTAKLFGEGLLIEEQAWSHTEKKLVTVVQIAYERLSDYLCVECLLDLHLDAKDPSKAFETAGPLDLKALCTTWSRPGFHEALHILVAERSGRELIGMMPALAHQHFTPSVFLNSLVWRDPKAITPQAVAYLDILRKENQEDVIETLVTLATIPDHPLNAKFTDGLLRKDCMAKRDAWWSIGLHSQWERKSAVDRLIQWANRLWPHTKITDESATLTASILAWLLPTSNRYLRDNATKALVRVLSWRPLVIENLLENFCELDDAYVVERVLAAAYGATMRTQDARGVAAVADLTHAKVFAAGKPRPHLLLREYAQGIIKRAQYLQKASSESRWPNIDPPYVSDWPKIPTESEIDAIAPSWSGDKSKSVAWGHHRIRSSVMNDDFGRYVIGTNFGSTNWLSLRLTEPQWVSLDQQIERAVTTLSKAEHDDWERFQSAVQARVFERFDHRLKGILSSAKELTEGESPQRSRAERDLAEARQRLTTTLGKKSSTFTPLMDAIAGKSSTRMPPKFDLKLVQRYVVGRVFDLGWTAERFDHFDSDVKGSGREAAKAERIGKKYQWIAYHEMLAYMADHYQFLDSRSRKVGAAYRGSWQEDVRDIDPSNVMQPLAIEESNVPIPYAFWGATGIRNWHVDVDGKAWASITEDIPRPQDLLFSRDEPSRSDWVNLYAHLKWSMPRPAYEDSFRDGRREVWMHLDGALVRQADIGKLKSKQVISEIERHSQSDSGLHEIYIGEIGWSEASTFFNDPYYAHMGWAGGVDRALLDAIGASQGYSRERGGFDCSIDSESISLRIPTDKVLGYLEGSWSGISATYVDKAGTVVAFDPSANVAGPSSLLLRKDRLAKVLRDHELAVCWFVHGEMTDAAGAPHYDIHARRSFEGIFTWDGVSFTGKYSFGKVESFVENS